MTTLGASPCSGRGPPRTSRTPAASTRAATGRSSRPARNSNACCAASERPAVRSSIAKPFRQAGLQAELIIDHAEPDLCPVHRHLLADEGVLGARVDVTERPLQSTALPDRAGAGDEMCPFGTFPCDVGGVYGRRPHVCPQHRRQVSACCDGGFGGGERLEYQEAGGPPCRNTVCQTFLEGRPAGQR